MQWLGRAMNRVLDDRGERATILGRDLGRHRGGGDRGVRRTVPDRGLYPLSARARVGRPAPTDDHGRQGQRACARDRGDVRRLSAHRQGPVRGPGFSRRNAAVGRQLDQLGPHSGADRVLLLRRGRSRRSGSGDLLRRADRQFRRYPGRLLRQAHGPTDRAADHRHQRERYSGAHTRDRALRAARSQGDAVALDGHSGVVQLRASAVRGLRPERGRGAGADEPIRRRRIGLRFRGRPSGASVQISAPSASTRPSARPR